MSERLKRKVCEKCGKVFYSYSSRAKYCSIQCARQVYNDSMKKPKEETKRRRTKKSLTIEEVVRRADEVGMSYGEYVAKVGEDDLSGI